jgi:hypothetical protein
MTDTRRAVAEYVSLHHEEWSRFLLSTYVLAQRDRIGRDGDEFRNGLPAIWGHSYVRTYYMWANSPPPERALMDGGVATSYYVIKALSSLLQRASGVWRTAALNEIAAFFVSRTTPAGVGVLTMDPRGIPKIATHLRHTCYGYLIMAELAESPGAPAELRQQAEVSAAALAQPMSKDELLREWILESWPVGGIASYIASHDHLNTSSYSRVWSPREKRYWPGVRERMLDALAHLTSTQLSRIGATKEKGKKEFDEHMPFWHPIKEDEKLRLHSTIGCLSLVGKDLAKREFGRKRIEDTVKELRRQILTDQEHAPRFSPDSPPSLSAACAMLKMVLGGWYKPTAEDREFIFNVLDFIRLNWREPNVYSDYWTEFTAPILQLEGILDDPDAAGLVQRGELILSLLEMPAEDIDLSSLSESDSEMFKILLRIMPVALGLPSR